MKKKILLTGATGYVGGLLLERLISEGYGVHVLARSPDKIMKRTGVEGREVFPALSTVRMRTTVGPSAGA